VSIEIVDKWPVTGILPALDRWQRRLRQEGLTGTYQTGKTMDYYQDSYQPPANDGYGSSQHDNYGPPQGGYGGGDRQNNPPLLTEKIFHDRKEFFLDLKENSRGRVLKITEKVGGRRDTIMVPMEVMQDLYEALGRIMDYERGLE
jgi:PurA ssDNA and RNA-binding protein